MAAITSEVNDILTALVHRFILPSQHLNEGNRDSEGKPAAQPTILQ